MRAAVAALAATLLLSACTASGDGEGHDDGHDHQPTTTTTALVRSVKATEVAKVEQPVAMVFRAGDPAAYVAEKTGRVRKIVDGAVQPQPVLDLSGQVSTGPEQGLLGLAWSPDGRYLYVDYTDRAGDTHVVEYEDGAGAGREVLFVDQPYSNHNGGHLLFGPDGKLWIGLGDGGSGGDPQGNAQDLGRLLGKLLRIDPRPSDGRPYGIPPDNPFVGRPGARGEIWASGLRNPWRYSFDRQTGDLWLADVGQDAWEEVDMVRAGSKGGENYGWPLREGRHPYRGGQAPPGAVEPVYDYSLDGGACAVVGGYVYRGTALASLLAGKYVFTDSCTGDVQVLADGKATSLGLKVERPASFAEDALGELYVLSLAGGVYRLEAGS